MVKKIFSWKASKYIVVIALWVVTTYGSNFVYVIPLNSSFGEPQVCLDFCRNVLLKKCFQKIGLELRAATYDDDLTKAQYVLTFQLPINQTEEKALERVDRSKLFAIVLEPPVVYPDGYDRSKHKFFQHIFTWHDAFVDDKQYRKIFFPSPFLELHTTFPSFHQRKFCTLINGYKIFNHPQELYSWRIKAIDFFNLDFYGVGWDKKQFPTYQGSVESKDEILLGHKFYICFENISDQPGWVSEKIRDCFATRTIPIYWGASNIEKIIPEDCYIDMRKFKNFEALAKYLNNFDERQYMQMAENMKHYIHSKQALLFSYEFFAYSIIKAIVPQDLNKIFDPATLVLMRELDVLSVKTRPQNLLNLEHRNVKRSWNF